MNNRISFYQQRNIDFLQQLSESKKVSAERPVAAVSSSGDVPGPAVAVQGALSPEEQSMIQKNFPSSSSMNLRLYGPNRNTVSVQPAAVGSRLDIQG